VTHQSGPPRLAPALPAHVAEHDQSPDAAEIRWYTIAEAAALCRRSPSTIRDLVSKHQLRRRLAWVTRRRLRQRVTMLSPGVVRWLQRVTLFRQTEYLEHPPT
jgi:hypothetical protein